MKKFYLICVATLLCGSLAACGNQAKKESNSSSRKSSSKVIKHHKKHDRKRKQHSSSNQSSASTTRQVQSNQNSNHQATQGSTNSQSNNNDKTGLVINFKDYGDHAGEAAYEYHTNGGNESDAINNAMNQTSQAMDNGQNGPINY